MAFEIGVFHRGESEAYCTVRKLTHNESLMGEDSVTVSVEKPTVKDGGGTKEYFSVGDWLMYRGVKYVVDVPPTLQKQARVSTRGNAIVFDSVKLVNELCHALSYVEMRDVTTGEDQTNFAARSWSLYCTSLEVLARRLRANLDRGYAGQFCIYVHGEDGSNKLIGNVAETPSVGSSFVAVGKKNVTVSFSDEKCWDSLAHVKEDFDVNFVIRNNESGVMSLYLGANGSLLAEQHFMYGKGNGLFKIERTTDTSQAIITKLRAYGDEKNMPTRYYKNVGMMYYIDLEECDYNPTEKKIAVDNGKISAYCFLNKKEETASGNTDGVADGETAGDTAGTATTYVFKVKAGSVEADAEVTFDGSLAMITVQSSSFWDNVTFHGKVYVTDGIVTKRWPVSWMTTDPNNKLPNNMNVKCLMLPGFGFISLKDKVKGVFDSGDAAGIRVLKDYYDASKADKGFGALCERYVFSDDPCDPWVGAMVQMEAYGVREGYDTFDDSNEKYDPIFPCLEFVDNDARYLPVQDDDASTGDNLRTDDGICDDLAVEGKEIAQWYLYVKDPGFDPYSKRVEGDSNITVSFKDGKLGGREFTCYAAKSVTLSDGTAGYRLALERVEDDSLNLYFPYKTSTGQAGKNFLAASGDEIVYLNMNMPDEYVEGAAMNALLPAALETLDDVCDVQYKWNLTVDPVQMARQHDEAVKGQRTTGNRQQADGVVMNSLHDVMRAGDILIFGDEDLGVSHDENADLNDTVNASILIDSIEIVENDGVLPKYTVNLVQAKQVSTLEKIQKQIDAIVNGSVGINGGSGGYSVGDIQKLIVTYGRKRFLSKVEDDTAKGNLTFDGNITAGNKTTHKGQTSSDSYVGGMLGSGWNVDRDGHAELQSLTVREFLQVPEIRFNRADILIGTNIQSVCGGVIKSVTQTSETGGVAELELGDDDLAGSIAVGDLCWGYFHDYGESKDANNATEDSDDCKGEINYKGFATVYFQVSEIMNGNSTKFRYELRPDLDDDNKQKYTLHPFVGMHFGGRGNTTDKDRQGFTITTPNYTATYQLVSSWDWSDVAKYVVRVSGRLDGFEALAMKEAGTWKNHYGTIDCNFYLRGSIQQVANTRRYIYITQQSNGMIDPGETEHVSIKIRDHYFQDVTAQFDILVKDMLFEGEEEVEIYIAYDDLKSDVTYYDVTATSHEQGADGEPLYTLTSRFIIRRNPEQILTIYTNIDNDPFIDNIEPKHIECGLRNNLGYDLTSAVTKWSITRISSDASADAIWATRPKVVYFDGSIDIYWSDDVEVNDIDLTAPTTKFRVTATIGDVEATTTINI